MELTDFYRTVWRGGFDGEDNELETLLSRAADVVNNAIYLSGEEVESISEGYKTKVFKAVCAQADYIDSCGGVEAMNESTGGSVSLGKFSYSSGTGGASGSADNMGCSLCRQAEGYLMAAGLLYKGVNVF
ncbi:MAG: hypothetical protein HFE79_12075 [Ruminiclostridium sp.]|nr:hypothetical protein [Ruminiclostridium sp.]